LTLTFTVDATAPLATVVAPFPSNPSADRTPTLNFSSNEARSTFECQLIPSNTAWAPCLSGITYDAQQDGNYTFNVRATDAAGNVSPLLTASSRSWHLGAADTVRPSVSARTPAVNAMSVSQTANVAATFSESVLGVSTNTFTLAKASTPTVVVPATVTRNGYTNQWVLNPTASLSPDTKYVAKLVGSTTGIRDFSNNPLVSGTATPVTWNFTTGPAPTVTTKSPALNATAVSRTANVTATFSENVAGVSGTTFTLKSSTGTTVSAAVTYNATTRVAVLNPGATLAARTKYTATLSGGSTKIRDGALNPLTSISWSFTTA
jgi:hypothetical protein